MAFMLPSASVIRLRSLRKRRELSLRKLADAAGVHHVSLVRLEAGTFDPRLSTLRKLTKALNVTISKLIEDQKPKKGGR